MYTRLENKRKFLHLALYNAVGIMAWDIMRKGGYPEPKRPYREKVIKTYNLLNRNSYKTRFISENSAPKHENW